MQVTPTVGREWAAATGMRDYERQMGRDPWARCATLSATYRSLLVS